MGRHNREALAMENPVGTGEGVSFSRKNGCYLTQSTAVGLFLAFVAAILATGLIVFFYASKTDNSAVQHSILPEAMKSTANLAESRSTLDMKESEKIDVRLPKNLIPIHYFVRLLPMVNGNFSIFGHVEATFNVATSTNKIILHIKDIITNNETVKVYEKGNQRNSVGVNSQVYDGKREFYIATLSQDLIQGKNYNISMEFEGYLNDNLDGFYRSSYKDKTGITRWLGVTQFQPTDARKAFPCMDEPGLKAEFSVILGREENMTSISNMPRKRSESINNMPGWFWDTFEKSVPMSTYLVAFAVTPFAHLESTDKKDYAFRVWARPNAIEQAAYSNEIGKPISRFFEKFFNVSFPLPKQDMVALPDFSAGAMENWGLITYRETAMLFDERSGTPRAKQRIGLVISHELAHQWFGNLVTPEWWTDLWLNEGFASYMEYLGLDAVEPTYKTREQFVFSDLQSVFGLDALESSHPINIPVSHPDEINEIFDRISYLKGSSIIRMMSHFLTEDTFRTGLSNYLKGLKYKSAVQDDLWRYLTEQAHKDGSLNKDRTVKEIMDTWTLQMGYPLITAVRKPNGAVNLKQERFLLVKNNITTDIHDYKWWVPITYTGSLNKNFNNTKPISWMSPSETEKEIKIDASNKWYILNVQQSSYYRVNYDLENWNTIINQLLTDHSVISTVNRAQLIDDALSLSRAGILDYSLSMKILSYLKKEVEYLPWASALRNLDFIEDMFSHKLGYGALRQFLLDMIVAHYDKLGFDSSLQTDHLDKLRSASITGRACYYNHQPCIKKAISFYNSWMANPNNYGIIPAANKYTTYCTAIREGGQREWEFAWDRYENANNALEKRTLLSAMGCSLEPWILSGFIENSIVPGKGIRKQDASTAIGSVARNTAGKLIAWQFLKNKWLDILEYYGSVSFTLGRIVQSTTGSLNTENQLKEFQAFVKEAGQKIEPVKRSINQAHENLQNNIAWLANYYDVIMKWLKENGYEEPIQKV